MKKTLTDLRVCRVMVLALAVGLMLSCSDDDSRSGNSTPQEESEDSLEFDISDLYALDYDSLAEHGIYLPCTCDSDSMAASARDEDWHPEMPLTSFEDIRERQQEWILQAYYKRGQQIHGVTNNYVGFRYAEDEYLKWGQLNGNNWMDYIDDEQPILSLSIPGTHDSYTFEFTDEGIWYEWGMTQEKCFYWQFNYGVRMFDLRINAKTGELVHGSLHTGYYLEDALGDMICQVHNYPSEGIFVVISKESGEESTYLVQLREQLTKCYHTIVGGQMYKGSLTREEVDSTFVAYSPDLRMKDIRGKICVFLRDKCVKNDTQILNEYKGTYIDFGDLDDGVQTGQCCTGEYQYLCQDYCSDINTDIKLSEIKTAFDVKTTGNARSFRHNKWISIEDTEKLLLINHLSGYCGFLATMSYTEAAETINSERGAGQIVRNNAGALGFMPMDFVGSEWVDPGIFGIERKTWGRRMCSYIWQHNFYQDNRELYWCMSNDQAQWYYSWLDYMYYAMNCNRRAR